MNATTQKNAKKPISESKNKNPNFKFLGKSFFIFIKIILFQKVDELSKKASITKKFEKQRHGIALDLDELIRAKCSAPFFVLFSFDFSLFIDYFSGWLSSILSVTCWTTSYNFVIAKLTKSVLEYLIFVLKNRVLELF